VEKRAGWLGGGGGWGGWAGNCGRELAGWSCDWVCGWAICVAAASSSTKITSFPPVPQIRTRDTNNRSTSPSPHLQFTPSCSLSQQRTKDTHRRIHTDAYTHTHIHTHTHTHEGILLVKKSNEGGEGLEVRRLVREALLQLGPRVRHTLSSSIVVIVMLCLRVRCERDTLSSSIVGVGCLVVFPRVSVCE
jgi:hypothetical protein